MSPNDFEGIFITATEDNTDVYLGVQIKIGH